MSAKHTPGPWGYCHAKGWGGDICIVIQGSDYPIFKAIKPKNYYTDYPDGSEIGTKIISTSLAKKLGRYVATPEIREEIDATEIANAQLIAAAPELLAALKEALQLLKGHRETPEKRERYERALDAIAKAEGGAA